MSLLLLLTGASAGAPPPTSDIGDGKIVLGQKESIGVTAVPTIGSATFGINRLPLPAPAPLKEAA